MGSGRGLLPERRKPELTGRASPILPRQGGERAPDRALRVLVIEDGELDELLRLTAIELGADLLKTVQEGALGLRACHPGSDRVGRFVIEEWGSRLVRLVDLLPDDLRFRRALGRARLGLDAERSTWLDGAGRARSRTRGGPELATPASPTSAGGGCELQPLARAFRERCVEGARHEVPRLQSQAAARPSSSRTSIENFEEALGLQGGRSFLADAQRPRCTASRSPGAVRDARYFHEPAHPMLFCCSPARVLYGPGGKLLLSCTQLEGHFADLWARAYSESGNDPACPSSSGAS